MNISDLNKKFASFFDWKVFLNKFLNTYGSPEVLNDSDEIIVMGLEYFKNLNTLIKEYTSDKDKEKTLKFAVIFHLIKFSLPLLSKEYRSQFTAIAEALTGTLSKLKSI